MPDLRSICELAWRQLNPEPRANVKNTKEEYIATGRSEYAYQMWLKSKDDRREDGMVNIPAHLLIDANLDVLENKADISKINALRVLENDAWIQNIGGLDCKCRYVRTTPNLMQALCGDDSLADSDRTFYVTRNYINFPLGAHAKSLPIIYISNGENLAGNEDKILIDDVMAGIIRRALIDIYGGKTGESDETNDQNPNK